MLWFKIAKKANNSIKGLAQDWTVDHIIIEPYCFSAVLGLSSYISRRDFLFSDLFCLAVPIIIIKNYKLMSGGTIQYHNHIPIRITFQLRSFTLPYYFDILLVFKFSNDLNSTNIIFCKRNKYFRIKIIIGYLEISCFLTIIIIVFLKTKLRCHFLWRQYCFYTKTMVGSAKIL